jgi:hypothetical protein
MIPAHVHLRLHLDAGARNTELWFADDPRLTEAYIERGRARGIGLVELDGNGNGAAELRLPARR